MNELIRPALFGGLGILVGVGAHASYQKIAASPSANARAAAGSAPAGRNGGATQALAGTPGVARTISAPVKTDSSFEDGKAAGAKDLDQLIEQIGGMANSASRDDFVRGVFTDLALRSPDDAMKIAMQIDDPRLQNLAIKTLALEWAFTEQSLTSRDSLETAMFGASLALASTNPEKAALLARANLEGQAEQFAMAAIGKRWATEDPEGAMNWVLGLPEEERGRGLMGVVASSLTKADPALAAVYLEKLPDERMRQWSSGQLADSWFKKDPKAAVAWATSIEDQEAQRRALRGVSSAWAESDPAAAIKWAQSLPDERTQSEAVGSATRRWAEQDAVAAASFATTLPAGSSRAEAIRNVASRWSRQDGEAAKAWAESLTVPEERTAAVEALNDRRGSGGRDERGRGR